jgi:hypothetical protein
MAKPAVEPSWHLGGSAAVNSRDFIIGMRIGAGRSRAFG